MGNATPLTEISADMTKIHPEENLGCPGGRNVGLRMLSESGEVDVVIELDDDGLLISDDMFRTVQQLFAEDPERGSPDSGSLTSTDPQSDAGAPAACGRSDAPWPGDRVPRRRTRLLDAHAQQDRPMAVGVLLRARGVRPGLACARRWLEDPERTRAHPPAPENVPRPGMRSTTGSPLGTGRGSPAAGSLFP